MTKQNKLPGEAAAIDSGDRLRTTALIAAVLLCLISCALLGTLDPRSLAVDSVYQGF